MKRLVSIVSGLMMASLLAAGCNKADKPAEGSATAAATPPPTGTEPAAVPATPTGAPADPSAAAADPAAGMPAAPAMVEPTAEEKATGEKAVVMIEEMATAADKNQADCKKTAAELQTIVDRNKSVIAAGKALDNNPGKKAWFEKTYEPRLKGAMGKLAPVMQKCQDTPELTQVFSAMQ
jgi:hypothetical protein